MNPQFAILIGAFLATVGWVYTARRNRHLSRKQHTINVILQANFNADYLQSRNAIAPFVLSGEFPKELMDGTDEALVRQLRRILNHHEFVAAGVRNGDLDEKLLRDSERAAYVQLYRACEPYVWRLRDGRDRQSLYEHLEWLFGRWTDCPPSRLQRCAEWLVARPIYGSRRKSAH